MSDMPAKILARPMMGVADRHCGPWALDDPYENAVEYHHADAVNALVEAAENAALRLDEHYEYGGHNNSSTGYAFSIKKVSNDVKAAIAAIRGPAE